MVSYLSWNRIYLRHRTYRTVFIRIIGIVYTRGFSICLCIPERSPGDFDIFCAQGMFVCNACSCVCGACRYAWYAYVCVYVVYACTGGCVNRWMGGWRVGSV